MQYDLAEKLMTLCLDMSRPIEAIVKTLDQIDNDKERDQVRINIGDVMGKLYNIMRPIIAEYPSLDPDLP